MLTMQIVVLGEMTLTVARQHIQAARYRFIVLAPSHQTKKLAQGQHKNYEAVPSSFKKATTKS